MKRSTALTFASRLSNIFYYKQIEYTDKKGKTKKKKDETAAPVLYVKFIYSDKSKQILSLFRSKGNDKVNLFNYLEQYCKLKMALIIESIYLSKNVGSLQIKASEVFVKPREALLTIKESDDESEKRKMRLNFIYQILKRSRELIFNTKFCIKNPPNH